MLRILFKNNSNFIILSLKIFQLLINLEVMSQHLTIKQRLQAARESDPNTKSNILSEIKDNRFYITFNRPARFNAFTPDMYQTVMNLIKFANQNDHIKFIIISGKGGNYSSGNDLSNFGNPRYTQIGNVQEMAKATAEGLQEFCASIINSSKPIFAIVQGKVIGFAFTQLALYDRVFAVNGAEFNAPLVQLAQGPQMCASYMFPKFFGARLGEDLIVKGTKVDCEFLQKYRFLQKFNSKEEANKGLQAHLADLNALQWKSYLQARKLFRSYEREILLDINKRQCQNLIQRWTHPNLLTHLAEYMSKVKSKKAKL